MKRKLALLLCLFMLLGTVGCAEKKQPQDPQIQSRNLTADVEGTPNFLDMEIYYQDPSYKKPEEASLITELGFKLLHQIQAGSEEGENILISPLSVILALGMTANGAVGETKAQMEQVLGTDLNPYLFSYVHGLPQGEKYKLSIANAVWMREMEGLDVKKEFLQTVKDYYNAEIYSAPFDDTTLREINGWVKEKTDDMIPQVLDKIDEAAVLYLINALAFDAEWQSIYNKSDIRTGEFTKEDGTVQTPEMMYSEEWTYLEDEKATGFVKYYKGREYAFAALLPNEGVTVNEYVNSLTAKHLEWLLTDGKQSCEVRACMPKFETEYDILLNDVLIDLGMELPFDKDNADFSAMAESPDGNIVINRVIHKTKIEVDERGTKAGAATVVEMTCESAAIVQEYKTVHLDRPFVYFIIDCEENVPVFMGTLMDTEN